VQLWPAKWLAADCTSRTLQLVWQTNKHPSMRAPSRALNPRSPGARLQPDGGWTTALLPRSPVASHEVILVPCKVGTTCRQRLSPGKM
jgi:hypothetical protein